MFFVCLFGAGAAQAKAPGIDADAGGDLLTPAEFMAGVRAEIEGRAAYFDNRPYTPNPYSLETQPYLWGAFVYGWRVTYLENRRCTPNPYSFETQPCVWPRFVGGWLVQKAKVHQSFAVHQF